jgi:Fic family protein
VANPDLIRAIESYRAARWNDGKPSLGPLDPGLLAAWIHHDNMLEGTLLRPEEINAALAGEATAHDPYLRPLLASIVRYREAIESVWSQAASGPRAASVNALKALHRQLTPDPKDRGGQYRRTSPVHRDYYQRICPAEKVQGALRKLVDEALQGIEEACDPLLFMAEIHRQYMEIYPFRRNPGTTARLFCNLTLLSWGYPPVILHGNRRREYYEALNRPDSAALGQLFRDAVAQLFAGEVHLP